MSGTAGSSISNHWRLPIEAAVLPIFWRSLMSVRDTVSIDIDGIGRLTNSIVVV